MEARPELEIGCEPEGFLKSAARAFPEGPAPEGRLLLDATRSRPSRARQIRTAKERVLAEGGELAAPHGAAVLVANRRIQGRQPLDLRKRRKQFTDDREGPWHQQ